MLHISILSRLRVARRLADKSMQISTAQGRGGGRKEEWCDRSRNWDRCVNVTEADRQGWDAAPVATCGDEDVKEGENARTDNMERRSTKRQYEVEGFVCIPLEEMESYFRYSQCCQQLQHSELLCVWCARRVCLRSCWARVGMEILTVTSLKHWTASSSKDHISPLTFSR